MPSPADTTQNGAPSQAAKAQRFLALHVRGDPLLLPNPWDAGSARLFASLGFAALATTSGGHAATLGRPDGAVSLDEALEGAGAIARAVDLPVSADLAHGFADSPDAVAGTVERAVRAGLAGGSVEDYRSGRPEPIYELGLAAERVAAAAERAHQGPVRFVLTARAENYLRGRRDLSDTIARLRAFQEVGADVLYAPGLTHAADIARVVAEVDRPVNVLAFPGVPPVAELAALGVARISVGSAFGWVALGAAAGAAREFFEAGTYGFLAPAAAAAAQVAPALRP